MSVEIPLFETPPSIDAPGLDGVALAGGWYSRPLPLLWSAGPRGTMARCTPPALTRVWPARVVASPASSAV